MTVGGGIVSEPETFNLLLLNCLTVWVKAAPGRAHGARRRAGRLPADARQRRGDGGPDARSSTPASRCTARPTRRSTPRANVPSKACASCARPFRPDAIKESQGATDMATARQPRRRRRDDATAGKPSDHLRHRIPIATRTGSSRSTGRWRRSRSASTRTAASCRATSSSSTRTTSASTSSSPTRCSASASSIPRSAAWS